MGLLPRSALATLALIGVVIPVVPAPLAAQGGGFLFKRPVVSLSLRAGYSIPRASSEIFEFTTEQLTIDRNDFNTATVGGDLAYRVTERLDVTASVAIGRSSTRSEFRDYIGEDDLPIEQETQLVRTPMTLGVRAYLFDRGRSVGRFAWIPARWSPYVGASAGYLFYRFEQEGEFVDFVDLSIFRDRFESTGWAPTAQVFGGADFTLSTRLVLVGEARYGWARAEMDRDFVGFDEIDLSGFQATVGLAVRF